MVPYLKPVAITAVLTGIGIAVVGTIIYSRMDSDPVECPAGLFFNKKPPDDLVAKLYVSVDESWFQLNVQPRFMWGWGGSVLGYCGAASLQSAALYYGTWISQEYPRRVAGNDSSPAFLSAAAHSFRLTVEEFDTSAYAYPQADHFLQWTQRHLYRGHVVIGTLYAYVHQIYTDPEFDHLVPIVGLTMTNESLRQYGDYDSWESEGFNYTNATNSSGFNNETNNNNTNVYTTNSLITTKVSTNITSVLYNDLSQPEVNEIDHPVAVDRVDYIVPKNKSVPFPFEYAFPDDTNFGLAVIGVMDTFGETYRTKLTPWSWTEPDWGREDGCNEIPALLNISIAVYGLTPGRVYSILRFDGNTSIPTSNFLGSRSYTKRWDFVARSSTYVQSPLDTIMTNTVMSYRTVLSDTQNVNSIFTTSAAAAAAAAAAPLTAAPTRASVRGSLWLDGARAQLKPKEASPPSPQGHNHAAKRVDWGVPLVCIEVLVSVVATLAYVTRRRWRTASSMMDSYEAV